MSSHREAPEMAKDPVADSTDVYAFVSPDRPDTVTLIANYIPFQAPDGGPNFYEFGDDVTYDIHISNKGKGEADITYRFHFHTQVRNPTDVPLQHRADHAHRRRHLEPAAALLDHPDQGRQVQGARPEARVPAGQHRPAQHARLRRPGGRGRAQGRQPRSVFAGQRADAFHVDLGQHLRPRRAAPVREPASDPERRTRSA